MSEIDWKNSGIYITANGIVGYCLLEDLDVHNPRSCEEDFDNRTSIISFMDDDCDDFNLYFIPKEADVRKNYIYDKIKNEKFVKGLKLNPDDTVSMCEIKDASWGFICSNDDDIEFEVLEEELKIFNLYRLKKEYEAVKYSFDGEFIESYQYLYGMNPEEAGVPLMMGDPVDVKYLKSFNLGTVDIESLIEERVFLDNLNLFDYFRKNLENEQIVDNVYEFSIDEQQEVFNRDEFVLEIFEFMKKIKVKDRLNSKVLSLICTYLMNEAQEAWDESYGAYGWT